MASSIIGDAKYQELNMSFTFDEQHEDKLIIHALADNNSYQLELDFNPDLDFEDLKHVLINKQFKLASKSPETLKLKIGVTYFEFKNVEKLTLNTLKETISELSSKLKEQSQKNTSLEAAFNKMKVEFDLMTTKIADLTRLSDETTQLNFKMNDRYQHEVSSLRQELNEEKVKTQSQESRLKMNEEIIQKQKVKIEELEKRVSEVEKLETVTREKQ